MIINAILSSLGSIIKLESPKTILTLVNKHRGSKIKKMNTEINIVGM